MKKKILLGILVLVGLFTITGCDNSNDNSTSVKSDTKKRYLVNLMQKQM